MAAGDPDDLGDLGGRSGPYDDGRRDGGAEVRRVALVRPEEIRIGDDGARTGKRGDEFGDERLHAVEVNATYRGRVIYIDPPRWPGHGRLWSHLISDVSPAELHAFAELLGVPRRGFERDHYDLPAERVAVAVWLGARMVSSREIVTRLHGAGLRRRRGRRGPG